MRDGYYSIDAAGPVGGAVTLRLGGSLDIGAREDLRDSIGAAVARAGAGRVLVDLQDVLFIDSEALAGLIEGFLEARESGFDIRAAGAQGLVLRVLQVTGTLDLFEKG